MKKLLSAVVFIFICTIVCLAQSLGLLSGIEENGGLSSKVIIWDDIKSSSFIVESDKFKDRYNQYKACDFKNKTAWCVRDAIKGQWIKIFFNIKYSQSKGYHIWRVSIINGVVVSKDLYLANNRIKKMCIEFSDGKKEMIDLKDGIETYQHFVLRDKNIWARWVKVEIIEVYNGLKYNDTCISELHFEEF